MSYRNRKLLDLSHKVNECQIQIPGTCIGYSPDGCEPAHSNQLIHGKGKGQKADDVYHAASCRSCHATIDSSSTMSREDKFEYWQRGFERTMLIYFANKWVIVK